MGNNRQDSSAVSAISERLRELRRIHYGERGKSQFARDLEIPLTSYVHYEAGRVPPAEVLVRAAKVTGTNLQWLLIGDGPRHLPPSRSDAETSKAEQVARRLAKMLEDDPRLLPAAEELLLLLSRMSQRQEWAGAVASGIAGKEGMIPVVGSTAAGLAHFWRELDSDVGGREADARLEEILARCRQQSTEWPTHRSTNSELIGEGEPIALVQYSQPDAQGFLEFLSAARLKQRYPTAIAWRIDGDSMSPRYRDRDFVITSPDHPAVELQPCVARQAGQIGVNCKLFQTQGDEVLLIPIDESCTIQRFPRNQLVWAWRVVASVRLGRGGGE